jgi:hypothetical protein
MQEESLVVRCSLVIAFVLRAAQSLRVFGAGKVSTFEKKSAQFSSGPGPALYTRVRGKVSFVYFHSALFAYG